MAKERFMLGPSDEAENIFQLVMQDSGIDRNKAINKIIESYELHKKSIQESQAKNIELQGVVRNYQEEINSLQNKLDLQEQNRKAALDYLGFKDIILEASDIRTEKIFNKMVEYMEQNQPQKAENSIQKKPGRPKKAA